MGFVDLTTKNAKAIFFKSSGRATFLVGFKKVFMGLVVGRSDVGPYHVKDPFPKKLVRGCFSVRPYTIKLDGGG